MGLLAVVISTLPLNGALKLSGVTVNAGDSDLSDQIPNLTWAPVCQRQRHSSRCLHLPQVREQTAAPSRMAASIPIPPPTPSPSTSPRSTTRRSSSAPLSDLDPQRRRCACRSATAAAFTDIDGPGPTYSVTGLPAGLTINTATGLISGTIDNSASLTDPFTITVTRTDGAGGSASDTFILTVTNPAPVAVDDTNAGGDHTTLSGNVLTGTITSGTGTGGTDTDPDADTIVVTTIAERRIHRRRRQRP